MVPEWDLGMGLVWVLVLDLAMDLEWDLGLVHV